MKKYDFCLLALYVCLVVVFFVIAWGYDQTRRQERRKGIQYFEEIYRTPVKTVVFQDTDAAIVVDGAVQNQLENGLEFSGSFDVRYAACFKISGDTLVFSGGRSKHDGSYPDIRNLKLHVTRHIRVDTINAPNVRIERTLTEQDGI
jgi:hypothetical protein